MGDPKYWATKLKAEQRAGREALERQLKGSIAQNGANEICRRVPGATIATQLIEGPDGPFVGVRVIAGEKYVDLSEPLMEFPSELLIAQIALVA